MIGMGTPNSQRRIPRPIATSQQAYFPKQVALPFSSDYRVSATAQSQAQPAQGREDAAAFETLASLTHDDVMGDARW